MQPLGEMYKERAKVFMATSHRYLLLGIALILFGLAFPVTLGTLVYPAIARTFDSRALIYVIESIFPLAGLIVALVGFFMRNDH